MAIYDKYGNRVDKNPTKEDREEIVRLINEQTIASLVFPELPAQIALQKLRFLKGNGVNITTTTVCDGK